MPVTDWIGESARTKQREDSFPVATRSGVVRIGKIVHQITAGVTLWARDCPELRQPVIAALFGVRPAAGFGRLARNLLRWRDKVAAHSDSTEGSPANRG